MKTIAIIQGRMGSVRLPGKIMMPLCGQIPALGCMLARVKQSKQIDQLIVATTTNPEDQAVVQYLQGTNQEYFRGSEQDLLDRYYQGAKTFGAKSSDIVVRLTADCPVIDPDVIDDIVKIYKAGGYDFVSNTLQPYSFPDGMDVEVFSFKNLERAWREASLPSHREHVTFYFWQHPDLFKIFYHKSDKDLTSYRLTLDYSEDYQVLQKVYEHFSGFEFSMQDILQFLDQHPEIRNINAALPQNAGWLESLEADKKFLNR